LVSTSRFQGHDCVAPAGSTADFFVSQTVLQLYWFWRAFNYKVPIMNWQDFTAFLVLAMAMSFSPGPNTTLSTALAANHGLRRTMPFVCAVPVGWGALLALCALGVGALVVAVPLLSWAVKLLGVGYLLWLAYRLAFKSAPVTSGTPAAAATVVTFWQGAALQFVNIKAWMLALSIVSGWIAGQANAPTRFAIVLPVMLVFAFASNLVYALVGSLLRRWLAGPDGSGARMLVFNRVMAGVLVATAGWMAVV
jgi:threonine/homoserine/homoserine lactone efflux protein